MDEVFYCGTNQNIMGLGLLALLPIWIVEVQSQCVIEVRQFMFDSLNQPFVTCFPRTLHQLLPLVNSGLNTTSLIIHSSNKFELRLFFSLSLGLFLREEEEEGLLGLLLGFLFLLLWSFLLVWSLIELGGYQQNSVVLDTFLIAPLFGFEVTLHGEH
jgi:hypothetical protein